MGLNATVRKLLTRNPGSSAIDAARVRNSAQVSPTDVANSITSVQRQIDAVVTVALADQTVSDPITVSGEDGGQIGWIGTVVQNTVSYLGMWFQNFWLGGTSPATAQIYSDSIGDVFIDGAEIVNTLFELNLNGVTTSIENLNSAVGVLSIKSLSNSTSYYSGATPTGFELLDNLGNSLGSLRSSGASGHLDLSNVAGTNTVNLITGGGGAPKLSIASAAGTVSMSPGTPLSVFGNTVVDSSRNGSFASVTASTGDVNITSGLLALNGTTRITNAGNAAFAQVAVDLKAAAVTGTSGGTGVGNAMLSATTAGLYLSLNGAAPVALGANVPGGSTTQVQYNNAGAFGGSANFAWDNATNILTVGPANTAGTGYVGTLFNSSATGATSAFQTSTGTFSITGAGNAAFQGLTLTNRLSSAYYAPAGSNQQIQFNNSGAPGASASLTWNGVTLTSSAMSTSALLVTTSGIGVTGASSITSASALQTLEVGNTGGGNAIKATAGILVTAGGLSVSTGGLSIVAGGFSVVGGIVANGNTGFTGTLAAAISGGRNVQYGIIY